MGNGVTIVPQPYTKPHLSYGDQVTLLKERGLEIADEEACIDMLRTVGYYRLSSYWYPLREWKPMNERTTRWNFRHDHFLSGRSFDQVVGLYEFDASLRLLVFEALARFETCLKAQIAYVGGAREISSSI